MIAHTNGSDRKILSLFSFPVIVFLFYLVLNGSLDASANHLSLFWMLCRNNPHVFFLGWNLFICLCRRGIRTSRNGPLGPNGLLVPGPATVEPLTRPAAAWTWSEAAESTSEASATKSATCR